MLISDAIEEYLGAKQNAITHSTWVWYDTFLTYFYEWASQHRLTRLEELSASHVQQFVSDCPTTNTHTRHARAQIVKGFLNWCARDEDMGVRRRMVERIEMPKLVQSDISLLTEIEVGKLLRACEKTTQPHRNRALVLLLLDTGIRAAECCVDNDRPMEETGLRMDNLILGRGSESFIRVMGKGLKPRTIGLGQETTMAVRRYINRGRTYSCRDGTYVFLTKDGDPLSVRMLQQMLDELGESAGIERQVHPHLFRHTFAVNQLLAGTSDLVLMRLMGHSTLESTKIYVRAMNELQARKTAISVVDQMRKNRK